MSITVNDIKILRSSVMADVPEGGGAATGIEVIDGASNNLFPDTSTLARTYGEVALRKVFAAVRTADTDALYGVAVGVMDPPDDPSVSALIFSTGDSFDTRADAQGRIESYLVRGPEYPGLLFGDVISGMGSLSLIQRTNIAVPAVGATLMLIAGAGTAAEVSQYVRITDVSSVEREFAVPGNDDKTFRRRQVNVTLSDVLRHDFAGCTPLDSYQDSSINWASSGKTRLYDTVVADAARYYGCRPLAAPIAFNAESPTYTVSVDSISDRIIPSAQTETPIADARPNQQTAAVVAAGSSLTQTLTLAFSASASLYIGGGILPGSLTLKRNGLTLTDANGRLYLGGATEVGVVDYANGLLSLSASPFGAQPGAHEVTYTPAATPTVVSRSIAVPVTAASQRLTYVLTLDPVPAAGSLSVSYLSGGRWYVLSDEGTGALTGGASGVGAGQLNSSTGTVSITLGALPDVGSRILCNWAPVASQASVSTAAELDLAGRVHADLVLAPVKAGGLTLSWHDAAGTARSATDNGSGSLQGDALGRVWYGSGRLQFAPLALPAPGTSIAYTLSSVSAQSVGLASYNDAGTQWTLQLDALPIKSGSLSLAVVTSRPVRQHPSIDVDRVELMRLRDDGAGVVYLPMATGNLVVGSINYASGLITLPKQIGGYVERQGVWTRRIPSTIYYSAGRSDAEVNPTYWVYTGDADRTVTLTLLGANASLPAAAAAPTWAWWSSWGANVARAQYGGADAGAQSGAFLLSELSLAVTAPAGRSISALRFDVGADHYVAQGYALVRNPSASTGVGEETGTIMASRCTLGAWTAGVSSLVTNARVGTGPASFASNNDLVLDAVAFRTAAAPVKPGGLSVAGSWADGTTFSATADEAGVINSGGVFGVVDYQTGTVECRFGTLVATPADPLSPPAGVVSIAYLGISGVSWIKLRSVQADTLRYNATSYSYIPLDADILGLDPVRLPSDGRVPIYRKGSVVVVHHTGTVGPATVSAGQVVNCGRTRLAQIEIRGATGARIGSGYTANLDAGTVSITDTTGWAQPVTIRHRIEDMRVCSEAQITGELRLTAPLTHDYPAGSLVTSVLLAGLVQSRVSLLQDQETWTGVWSDDVIGNAAAGSYDRVNTPPTVTNLSAVTERWRITFTSSTAFACYGEHLGQVGTGSINQDFEPLNPATGAPYFILRATGWGGGWATGNTVRLNTVGAMVPIWVARVIKPGAGTVSADQFSIGVLADIDTI